MERAAAIAAAVMRDLLLMNADERKEIQALHDSEKSAMRNDFDRERKRLYGVVCGLTAIVFCLSMGLWYLATIEPTHIFIQDVSYENGFFEK